MMAVLAAAFPMTMDMNELTSTTNAIFRVRDVTKVYDMGEVQVQALRGINLELYEHEFVVLLGASGSGKSTLLNIMGGLDVPSSGTVHYHNTDLTDSTDADRTRYRRDHVGFFNSTI